MDLSLFEFISKAFFGFFAIMNPVANTPIFVGLTEPLDNDMRRAVARKAVTISFIVVAIFSAGGRLIFDLFGLTFPAFRIAGGIIIFLVGLDLLRGEQSKIQTRQTDDGEDEATRRKRQTSRLAVSPLAVPILAGPGTITTALNFVGRGDWLHIGLTAGIFLVICVITYFMFAYGERLIRRLGESTIDVVSRLMGFILATIGVEMAIRGVTGAIDITAGNGRPY